MCVWEGGRRAVSVGGKAKLGVGVGGGVGRGVAAVKIMGWGLA